MRFSGREDECVAGFDGSEAVFIAGGAFAGNHIVKLQLRTMQMVRVRSFAGRDANDFNVERMPFVKVGGLRFSAQCFRNFSSRAGEFAFG